MSITGGTHCPNSMEEWGSTDGGRGVEGGSGPRDWVDGDEIGGDDTKDPDKDGDCGQESGEGEGSVGTEVTSSEDSRGFWSVGVEGVGVE